VGDGSDDGVLEVHFGRGVGDCVYFAHQLPLYVRRGHKIRVSCDPDKRILFEPCGVEIVHERGGAPEYPWDEAGPVDGLSGSNYAGCNRAGSNIGRPPLPYVGEAADLWDEFASVRLDPGPFIPDEDRRAVDGFLRDLPRPVVLLHTVGDTSRETKGLPAEEAVDLYERLLDATQGTLVLLDWDDRVPRLAHGRVRHLTDDWGPIELPRLIALIDASDLVIGVDSGPFHAARFTDTPSMGVFNHTDHYPARVTLPRGRQLTLVPRDSTHEWNKRARAAYNIVHCDGPRVTNAFIAEYAARMLAPPRYLTPDRIGQDVLLQQFVFDFERGVPNYLAHFVDRNRSFDVALRTATERFERPVIVETGCVRVDEDFRGAGFSTYLLGLYAARRGGRLFSVDLSLEHCDFARRATAEFGGSVEVTWADSLDFLRGFDRPIDLLLLDSLDTEDPRHAEHGLDEIRAASHRLHENSVVMIDDTVFSRGGYRGKGARAIPWMLENGWRVLYHGYQAVLVRSPG